ncbi:hypothetical protein Tco_0808658 [Tanacetum coccineum]
MPNTLAERRSTFRKGIFCAYCKKEGHPKECYKLLGYPSGHPLHNKYQPPSQKGTSAYKEGGQMDQLQNQLNQVLMMMQNPQTELPGIAPHVAVDNGATDHICISLSIMHNITKLTTPIIVYLPNGQSTEGHDRSSTFGTLHGGLYHLCNLRRNCAGY